MKYIIYQPKEVTFDSFLVKKEVTDYKKDTFKEVYTGDIEVDRIIPTLERLFAKFNLNHPKDLKGHSLSTGDIVILGEKSYICDIFGWKEINLI